MLHTGPINRAGGLNGKEYTPTTDGWFDPVSLEIDPQLGTAADYKKLADTAERLGGVIAGDIVPLHTGTGPDFHLGLRNAPGYPGMYMMIEIPEKDWGLLPEAKSKWEFALVPRPAAEELTRKGYIPGLINSNDAAPEAKTWSGWSASAEIKGVDGKARRWVYLHFFKPTQPVLNWLDPSYNAREAVAGAIVVTVRDRKTRVVRLDAVPFLGVGPKPDSTETWHYMHPLSVTGTNDLAYMTRKLGGFSFQELNVPLRDLKRYADHGPDLSYDFFTRAQIMYALLSEDAGPLRLAFRWLQEADVPAGRLVHDLQNHDEVTFQTVQLADRRDEKVTLNGEETTAGAVREKILTAMRTKTAGEAAPYNRLYRANEDGLATTFAGFIAPAIGIADPYHATPGQVEQIKQAHLLLTAANGYQPGVLGLSAWDLVGALPIPADSVEDRTEGGDWRWINRGGVDLMGANPDAPKSAFGIDRAKALYGPLPDQLKNPKSFASRLKAMLAARKAAGIPLGEVVAIPEPKSKSLCVLVVKLPDDRVGVTVLNFAKDTVEESIDLGEHADKAGGEWREIEGRDVAPAMAEGQLRVKVPGRTGVFLVAGQSAEK